MKRKTIFVPILIMLALLVVAFPAAADGKRTVGEQISLVGSDVFEAGAPFHIRHGWIGSIPHANPPKYQGSWGFELEIDGIYQKADYLLVEYIPEFDYMSRNWVYNFPDGMTGTHKFTGHWIMPCAIAVDEGYFTGPCSTPNEKIVVNTRELTVTFVP
jgi:hypothetical protein